MLQKQNKMAMDNEEILDEITKEAQKEFQISAKWDWMPCNYELCQENDGILTITNLNPTLKLSGSDMKLPPKVDISISLERSLMHSDELGWNWHKSWNLPNININIKIIDPKTNETMTPPSGLKAKLMAVKVLSNKAELFRLYDLGLTGSYTQQFINNQVVFSGIKFSSTSYNNDGVKFHLIALVYLEGEIDKKSSIQILYSGISPPIFVDSRKSARDSNIIKNQKIVYKYFDPFLPESFNKMFIKRNNKKLDSIEEMIENSLEGLSQYFTAPNIRNKVKHPVFLAVKFSNCTKLLYNTELLTPTNQNPQMDEVEIIETMQKIFMENYYHPKDKNDNHTTKSISKKYFILLIEEQNHIDSFQLNKKISDYVEPLQNEVLHVVFNSNVIPNNFQIINHERLRNAYGKIYTNLLYLKNAYLTSFFEFNQDCLDSSENNNFQSFAKIKKHKNYDNTQDYDQEDEDYGNNLNEKFNGEPPSRKKQKFNLTPQNNLVDISENNMNFNQFKSKVNTPFKREEKTQDANTIADKPRNESLLGDPIFHSETLISNTTTSILPQNLNQQRIVDKSDYSDKKIINYFTLGSNSDNKDNTVKTNTLPSRVSNGNQNNTSTNKVRAQILPIQPKESSNNKIAALELVSDPTLISPTNNMQQPNSDEFAKISNSESTSIKDTQQSFQINETNNVNMKILMAYQQEQLKNQILMNYITQNLSHGIIDQRTKMEMLGLSNFCASNNITNGWNGNSTQNLNALPYLIQNPGQNSNPLHDLKNEPELITFMPETMNRSSQLDSLLQSKGPYHGLNALKLNLNSFLPSSATQIPINKDNLDFKNYINQTKNYPTLKKNNP